jgi:hypothetical protein
MIRAQQPPSLESRSQIFGKRIQMNMACLAAYFYKLKLMVEIGKICLKFKKIPF